MHRHFIAFIVAASVAIAGLAASAAPARADSEDIAKALAGIAALVIIGKAIEKQKDREHVSRKQTYPQSYPQPRPLPHDVRRKLLPAECLFDVRTRHGHQRFFGARCLQNNYRHASSLPRACTVQIPARNGWRYGYDPRCLRQSGYRIARI